MVSSLLNLRLMEILGLSLAVMAVISTGILAFAAERRIAITVEEDHVRIFKGEESAVTVGFESRGSRWVGFRLISCDFGNVQATMTKPEAGDKIGFGFAGKYAARSRGLRVRFAMSDMLGLLQIEDEVVHDDLVLDILPRSLLALMVSRTVPAFGLGERPAGYPGQGQELYGVDYYHPSTDAKDIIWKRVARSPGETLVGRVRESNVKESVRFGVLQLVERKGEDRQRWMDMLCEGLASMGKEVLEMGVRLTVLYRSEGSLVIKRISNVDELAEAIMSYSTASPSSEIADVVRRSDLVVTGLRELESEGMAGALSRKPVLVISEGASSPMVVGRKSVVYSGRENFLPLLRRVLER